MLEDFEKAYARCWRLSSRGRGRELEAVFEEAKSAAVKALQNGATPDDIAESMRKCRNGEVCASSFPPSC